MSSAYQFTNNAASTLAAGISSSDTSLTVATGTGGVFPTLAAGQFCYCTLQNTTGTVVEIVKVTAHTVSSDTFTIVRAQENTVASSFSTGDKFELRLTAGEINRLFAGSAIGGGDDQVFFENGQTVTTDYTITSGKNALSAGPITVNSGITVTIPTGSTWTVV